MILSPDHYLYDDQGNYLWSEDRLQRAWSRVTQELPFLLLSGRFKKVVFMVGLPGSGKSTWLEFFEQKDILYLDATFIYQGWRTPLVKIISKYGIPMEALVFQTPWETILKRNQDRPSGRAPNEETLKEWFDHLHSNPPTKAEGFEKISLT